MEVVIVCVGSTGVRYADALNDKGLQVGVFSVLTVEFNSAEVTSAIDALDSFDWVVFTSANAVHAVCETVQIRLRDGSPLVRVAAIGHATADAAQTVGLRVDVTASEASGAGLTRALQKVVTPGETVLLPQSSRADASIASALTAMKLQVVSVTAYNLVRSPGQAALAARAISRNPAPIAVFSSPSIVHEVMQCLERSSGMPATVCFGSATESALRNAGFADISVVMPDPVAVASSVLAIQARTQHLRYVTETKSMLNSCSIEAQS